MTAKPPFKDMLNEHITPVLKAAGFRKKNTRYTREFAQGNAQTIDFDEINMPGPDTWFQVNIGVDTYGDRATRYRRAKDGVPKPGRHAATLFQYQPLPGTRHGAGARWRLEPDLQLGTVLAELFDTQWIPQLDRMADLVWVENALRTGEGLRGWPGFLPVNRDINLLFVIAAQRDDPEIDHLAAKLSDPSTKEWLPLLPRGR